MISHENLFVEEKYRVECLTLTIGWVTDAKNQGNCGSCAAFASGGLHETCMAKAGASLNGLDLSEQYLVDCAYDGK